MHRFVSTRTSARRTSVHPRSGTASAPVGQLRAHGMSAHIAQALDTRSRIGVPDAMPASWPSLTITPVGQTLAHVSQRVQAATNAASGSAPGGRMYAAGAIESPSARPARSMARVSPRKRKSRRLTPASDPCMP